MSCSVPVRLAVLCTAAQKKGECICSRRKQNIKKTDPSFVARETRESVWYWKMKQTKQQAQHTSAKRKENYMLHVKKRDVWLMLYAYASDGCTQILPHCESIKGPDFSWRSLPALLLVLVRSHCKKILAAFLKVCRPTPFLFSLHVALCAVRLEENNNKKGRLWRKRKPFS